MTETSEQSAPPFSVRHDALTAIVGTATGHYVAEWIGDDGEGMNFVAVTDSRWPHSERSVLVPDDALIPKCECGALFRLCHPEA